MCSAGVSSCSHVQVTASKKNKSRIIVGHGFGLRPTRKERDLSKKREQYRMELEQLRSDTGVYIPFGANLDLYKNKSLTVKKI